MSGSGNLSQVMFLKRLFQKSHLGAKLLGQLDSSGLQFSTICAEISLRYWLLTANKEQLLKDLVQDKTSKIRQLQLHSYK